MPAMQPEPWLQALITTSNSNNDETNGYTTPFANQTFVEHRVSTRNLGINI
jgi:hypothetical protein